MNDFANAVKGASESSTEQADMLKQIEQGNRADFQCRTEQLRSCGRDFCNKPGAFRTVGRTEKSGWQV